MTHLTEEEYQHFRRVRFETIFWFTAYMAIGAGIVMMMIAGIEFLARHG